LPEFFLLIATDLFLLLSLLTCLLDTRFPKMLPYVFEVAALAGFGHLLISKEFLTVFGEQMRFWYSFAYLVVALVSILASNAYILFVKRSVKIAQIWAGAITFPSVLINAYFVNQYYPFQTNILLMMMESGFLFSAILVGAATMLLRQKSLAKGSEELE